MHAYLCVSLPSENFWKNVDICVLYKSNNQQGWRSKSKFLETAQTSCIPPVTFCGISTCECRLVRVSVLVIFWRTYKFAIYFCHLEHWCPRSKVNFWDVYLYGRMEYLACVFDKLPLGCLEGSTLNNVLREMIMPSLSLPVSGIWQVNG
jgi:hypothetical protein